MRLSSRMPDLASLDLLMEVAEAGSLSAVGRNGGLTQQAVSARMAALEAQVGVQLVARTSRGSQLTVQGRLVVQWADRLMQAAAEMDAGLSSLREGHRRRLRVSASLTVAEQLLPGWLVSLHASAHRRQAEPPDVVLTATNSEKVEEDVRSGAADLGFVEGPRVPRELRSKVVARDELVLVVWAGHPWARRRGGVGVAELARTPLVTREPGSGTRDSFEAALGGALEEGAPRARPVLELSTAASVRAAVLAGSAPAVVSRLVVDDDVAAGRLLIVPVQGIDLRRELRVVWLGGRTPPSGAARDLVAHIATLSPTGSRRG